MNNSLSVLLPVRNAERALPTIIQAMMDILPDLTSQFEVIVIDDGSDDATIEVIDEVVMQFPQIRVLRHAQSSGYEAALRTGIQNSQGNILFFKDEHCPLALDDLHLLWRAIEQYDIVVGHNATSERQGGEKTLCYQMIHRQAITDLRVSTVDQNSLVEQLVELGYSLHEIAVNRQEAIEESTPISSERAAVHSHSKTPEPKFSGSQGKSQQTSKPKQPNFLHKGKKVGSRRSVR